MKTRRANIISKVYTLHQLYQNDVMLFSLAIVFGVTHDSFYSNVAVIVLIKVFKIEANKSWTSIIESM